MSYRQESRQAGYSTATDANGYKVDHRSETERRSESKETRRLTDGQEIHKQQSKTVNLEELKSRETSRIATAEDVRALLEAEFEGIREIQTSREISLEEFNLIESQFRKKQLGGRVECETSIKEAHRLENVLESPQWKSQFGMPVFTKNEIADVREATVVERNYLDPSGNVVYQRSTHSSQPTGPEVVSTTKEYPDGSLRHESKQKRHVTEEIFIEGSDKFYEKGSAKKAKRIDDDVRRSREVGTAHDQMSDLRRHTPQRELVVEDTNVFKDESKGQFSHDYKIKPMHPVNQTLEGYSSARQLGSSIEKENAFPSKAEGREIISHSGPQQEIIVRDVATFREGSLDVNKNRSVELINQDLSASNKSKGFKKKLNQKDIKFLPKIRRRQEEIIINDPTVYDETQFLSLRKAKKKGYIDNPRTLPAKLGKKRADEEIVVSKSGRVTEEYVRGSGVVTINPLQDASEQVVLEEPDIFRETTSTNKKQKISYGSLEKQQKKLEKIHKENATMSLGRLAGTQHKGPQEEVVIDDPEMFRETTLKKAKKEKATKPENKILNDILQDVSALNQEAKKSSGRKDEMDELDAARMMHRENSAKEIVLDDNTVFKETTLKKQVIKTEKPEKSRKSEIVDQTSIQHKEVSSFVESPKLKDEQMEHEEMIVGDKETISENVCMRQEEVAKGTVGVDVKSTSVQQKEEIVLDDHMLYSDHNRPKNIHIDHGKPVHLAEIDDFNLPELTAADAEQSSSDVKQEKIEKKPVKSKKFFFKKKKKLQGESVVDESFVYEDAGNIRVPNLPKESEEAKVTGGKSFWNWNFSHHKAQQEVIKDESHYHEDHHAESKEGDLPSGDEGKHLSVATTQKTAAEQVYVNQNVIESSVKDAEPKDAAEKETEAEVKVIYDDVPVELPLPQTYSVLITEDHHTHFVTKPMEVDSPQKSEVDEVEVERKIEVDEVERKTEENVSDVDVQKSEVDSKEKHKFKIHLPSFTIPKPHINFGFNKHQHVENVADDKPVVSQETKPETVEEKHAVDGKDAPGVRVDVQDKTIVLEKTVKGSTVMAGEKIKDDEDGRKKIEEVKIDHSGGHKSKFHLPSFTIPKPHIHFGHKKHQKEVINEDSKVVVSESKPDEVVKKETDTIFEEKTPTEKHFIREEVVVEKFGDVATDVKVTKISQPDSKDVEDKKVVVKSDDHKFKIHLPHVPTPHFSLSSKKSKEEDSAKSDHVQQEPEQTEDDKLVREDKFKIKLPHIGIHEPGSIPKQEEIVVDDKTKASESIKTVTTDNPTVQNLEINIDYTKSPDSMIAVESTSTTPVKGEDQIKDESAMEDKSKRKLKFDFPHFSLPKPHGKQQETVTNESTLVRDSTKVVVTKKKIEDDDHSEEMSEETEDADKEKKVSKHKFKIRLPKPHFNFGLKTKDKHKIEESKEEVNVGIEEKTAEPEMKMETIDKSECKDLKPEKETSLEFLQITQPCVEEFTETVNYVLEPEVNYHSEPITIKVDPDEYKLVLSKPKDETDKTPKKGIDSEKAAGAIRLEKTAIDVPQVAVSVPYYEYEPDVDEKICKNDERLGSEFDQADANQETVDKSKSLEVKSQEHSEKTSLTEHGEADKRKGHKTKEHKSKFKLPCIKIKKPFLKKHDDAELSDDDEPPYGETSTDKEASKQTESKPEDKTKMQDVGDQPTAEVVEGGVEKIHKKKHHPAFTIRSLGRKPVQEEIVVNDTHIYTDCSTLGRKLLRRHKHKGNAPEGGAFILENNLPESSESRKSPEQPTNEQAYISTKSAATESDVAQVEKQESKPAEHIEQIVPDGRQASHDVVCVEEEKTSQLDEAGVKKTLGVSTLERSKESHGGSGSLSKFKKQDELVVGGESIVTEPQTSHIHKALHKHHLKADEHVDKPAGHDAEKATKKKDHGIFSSIFHRHSGEYDLDHPTRTNQPLVELIGSRQKPEETEALSSSQAETSWTLGYSKNLTLDVSNHLTFESDQIVSTENLKLLCPTARRSYRKQVQIDDYDTIQVISTSKTAASADKTDGPMHDADLSRGKAAVYGASRPEPVKWTSSLGKNTSFFSTLPDFATVSDQQQSPHFVVVAIDFGTTFSGYAFSFKNDVDSIHIMRKWEGGDPGVTNQKTPTTLLLTPEKEFHSFGFTARDYYHDLSPNEAKRWLYFEKFKMALHYNADLTSDTEIQAANGTHIKALEVFAYALRFFKNNALQEISEQTGTQLIEEDVRWVITVPAIWKAPAKQFMREAAYKAGIASSSKPDQLLIALEPEAASIFVRKQRLRQLVLEEVDELKDNRTSCKSNQDLRGSGSSPILIDSNTYQSQLDESASWSQSVASNALSMSFQRCPSPTSFPVSVGHEIDITDNRFMLADCGGGTVDITVYEMLSATGGKLKELYKASGGPYGSIGVDIQFEKLLVSIFGQDFIDAFKLKRPAGWVDFMMAFESRKRAANPFKTKPLNVSLPFSFIDYYKKLKNTTVESAVRKFNSKDVKWSSQGMLRLMPEAMNNLFQPTLDNITVAIANVLRQQDVSGVKHIFLVGGFAESPMLQQEIRKNFAHQARILTPTDVSLTILKGAVLYGIDPSIVVIRKSRLTYGLGVLNRFVEGKHPESKKALKDGVPWCVDVFDSLVNADQSVALGSSVIRSYTPAGPSQKFSLFHIYCTESREADYVTDEGVVKCGTLRLDLDDHQWELDSNPSRPVSQNIQEVDTSHVGEGSRGRREIQARLTFGDTEIKIIALDVATGNYVKATLDFLNK